MVFLSTSDWVMYICLLHSGTNTYILEEGENDEKGTTSSSKETAANLTKEPYPTTMIGPMPPVAYPMGPDPWRFHPQMGNDHQ